MLEKAYRCRILPYLTTLLLSYYLFPMIVIYLPNRINLGLFLLPILIVNPLTVLLTNFGYAVKYGWNIILPFLTAVTFLPAIYIYYNDSALPYLVMYLILALIAVVIGGLVKKYRVDPYREAHNFGRL